MVQRARAISLSKVPVRKRPRNQSVRMFRYRYTVRHEKISTRQSPLSGAWSEIGEDPWVMGIVHGVQNPVCEPATTGNLGPAYQLLP